MFKHKIAAATLGVLMIAPLFASASTLPDAQSQIESLLTQIKALQEQLHTLIKSNGGNVWQTGTTTPGTNNGQPCFMPGRRLGLGIKGDDVKDLQEMLKKDKDNEFDGESTGFFGPRTQHAMKRFHDRMGIGSSTDGSVGPRTQDFFKKHCDQRGKHDEDKGDGMMNNNERVSGTIKAHSTSSIAVETSDGKSVVVNFTASTTVQLFIGSSTQPTTGSAADLLVGKKVRANGTENSDGSITAVRIMVGDMLPMMRKMMDNNKDMGERNGNKERGKKMHDMMSDDTSETGQGKGR